ncbi:GxxExxY protein [Candidatus Acetothermia bacterium]|jgi:GxxExxY protein|nr:GxxExxY protein [Candidatus Acetothermia bacterium]MCI2427210.1 GxxExxY protein [Candidatus Acetothermia bacterium]MCI2428599.1 GxxExxY protein [Candidatus Acetothermia bacterium]
MNTNEHEKILHKELSYKVIGAVMEVHNTLGAGFLEKVYENAVIIKLNKNGMKVVQQAPLKVHFEGEIVGEYFADILVEDEIILEMKCVEKITDIHRAQVINYLKATGLKLGIIINFARPKLEYERIVL